MIPFHVHVADKAGFCIICGHLSRPARQQLLDDFDIEYDDEVAAANYENDLLKAWRHKRKYRIHQDGSISIIRAEGELL